MCSFSSEHLPYSPLAFFALHRPFSSKRHQQHLRFNLHKRRRAQLQEARRKRMIVLKTEIKMRNLKLYMENQSIIEENEKLRKQALLLHKENQTLLSQLQKKISKQSNTKTN
ncbi:Protein LITTLE ZIPPER 2, partial [Mucuna pruriens]